MTTQCNDGLYVETINGASQDQTLSNPTISGGQASNLQIVGGSVVGAMLKNTVIAVDGAGLPILSGDALARAGDVAEAFAEMQGRLMAGRVITNTFRTTTLGTILP